MKWLLVACCLLQGAPAIAGTLQVAPVRVDLSRRATSAIVAVRNQGDEPIRLQLEVYDWSQDDQGKMDLKPSKELLLYPLLLELKPNEERNLRVGAPAGAFGLVERAGRLLIQEMPSAPKATVQSQVRVLSRVSIPVFLAPDRALDEFKIESVGLTAGEVKLRLTQPGTVSVRPIEAAVEALDAAGAPLARERWEGWYVLAGGTRNYQWDLAKDLCPRVRSLRATVQLEGRQLTANAPVQGGACAP
jgi:fimbrial chaperone protein